MQKNILISMALMALLSSGCTKKKQPAADAGADAAATVNATSPGTTPKDLGAPPVVASCVTGLPLFAPFNEGDIMDGGKALRQTPEKYTYFILGETCLEVSYKEEKNKQLAHDNSFLNQYVYKTKDEMKGQVYTYADPKAMEQYLSTHGDMSDEGEVIPVDYKEGILVTADYLKGRSILSFYPTTTEDPDGPAFPAGIVTKVEKLLGVKVEKSRIVTVIGDEEYQFGIMTTQPNDAYGIAAWVLSKGSDISIWTDTCEVVKEDGRVYWSNYDPDEYMEPQMMAVVKGPDGLDLYCTHASTDETMNYFLMRQKGNRLVKYGLGGFYQQYE